MPLVNGSGCGHRKMTHFLKKDLENTPWHVPGRQGQAGAPEPNPAVPSLTTATTAVPQPCERERHTPLKEYQNPTSSKRNSSMGYLLSEAHKALLKIHYANSAKKQQNYSTKRAGENKTQGSAYYTTLQYRFLSFLPHFGAVSIRY